jgi:hypothetical protein
LIGRPRPVVWPTDLSALDPPSSLPQALRYAPLAPASAPRVLDPVAGDPFGDVDIDTRPASAPRAAPERGASPARCDAVIVNYNAGALLAQAVASLQRSPRVARIVVVDNASVDDSLARLEAECADATRLTVLRSAANLGFARGCNLGAARTDAPFVLYLNPDCVVADDAVELLLDTLAARPEGGMAGPMIVNPDGSEQAGARRAIPTPWRSFVRAFGLSRLSVRYPGCSRTSCCTASRCRTGRPGSRRSRARACSCGARASQASDCSTRATSCTARISTGACASG